MFRLLDTQMEAFSAEAHADFERALEESVRDWFPVHAQVLGPAGVRELVRRAEARAEEHGIVHRRGVEQILALMVLLGSGFDRDPQLPWAAERLADEDGTPTARADRLYATAGAYLDRVAGPHSEYLLAALYAAHFLGVEAIPRAPSGAILAATTARLRALYPTKCAELGDAGVEGLAHAAISRAARYGLDGERGVTVTAFAMILLGSDFDDDPALPWMAAALAAPAADEAERVDRLVVESQAQLGRWLGDAGGES